MNNTERAIIIIASMSKSEKRSFKLYCNTQEGEKIYLQLFDIIDKFSTENYSKIESQFIEISQTRNIEIAADYLYKTLLNFLVSKRSEKRIQSKIYHLIEKSNILFDRKLFNEAFEELNKANTYATLYEDDAMQIIISRTEMRYLSYLDFPSITEKELVAKQMNLLAQTKYSRTINQYNFLLDILRHRLLYKGILNPDEKKNKLNDLVLNELNLVSNTPDLNFQSQKAHLLFQSTYHLEVGDYALAVRNYKYLIELFNQNSHLMQNPPIYYLSAIEGVLDSLLTMGIYSEMQHFLSILSQLYKKEYPSDFLLKLLWINYFHQISIILHTGTFERINDVQISFTESLVKNIKYLPLDIQLQFYLTNTLLLVSIYKFKDAHKMIKNIFSEGKIYQRLPMFRLVKLINILIYAELGDVNYVESEIIAFKRNLKSTKLSKTEKLVFKFAQSYPLPCYNISKQRLWTYFSRRIRLIRNDKFEKRILKYFNFCAFIESRLTDASLADILNRYNNR